ncbi:MAG: PKD domain-containing protein [Flavobacteriales bacterium]
MKITLHLTYLFFILVLLLVLMDLSAYGQRVGTSAYVKGNNIEIGVDGDGGFEGVDIYISPAPAGMHYRSNTKYFGFVANPQKNNWASYDGDFFTPGAPRNGWGIEIPASNIKRNNNRSLAPDITGTITEWKQTYDCISTTWEGTSSGLKISVNYFLQENDLFYTTTITITNNTGSDIPEMFYYRTLDPDNNVIQNNSYSTDNTIESQPGSDACNVALVSAQQSMPWVSYLGLAGIGADWKVGYGGVGNADGSDMWNGSFLFTQTAGSVHSGDEEIYIANRIQNLAAGKTATIRFVVILSATDAAKAINNLVKLVYPGSANNVSSVCTPYIDTVKACQGALTPIQIQGAITNNFTWTWSPTTDITIIRQDSVNINPQSNITYTITGTPINSCFQPIAMSFALKVLPSATTTVPNDIVVCHGSSVPIGNFTNVTGATFNWTNSNADIGLAASGSGNTPAFIAVNSTSSQQSSVITVTANLAGACTGGPKSYNITVNPKPKLNITDPSGVCLPATIDLTKSSITQGSDAGLTLTYWTDAAATTSLSSPSTLNNGGTFYIKGTSAAGCESVKPVTVVVNTAPALVVTNPTAVCQPQTIDITAASISAGSTNINTLSYWTDAAANSSLTNSSAISASGIYYIKATSADGCSEIKPVSVSINNTPTLVITNPAAVCAPLTINLSDPSVTAGSSKGTLSYWTDAAATSSLNSFSALNNGGVFYIKLSSDAGCESIKPVTAVVNSSPSLVVTNPAAVCQPQTIDLTASSVSAGSSNVNVLSYWTDAAASSTLVNSSAISNSGTYYIKATSTDGCSEIKAVTATVNAMPSLMIHDPAAVCTPQTIDLTKNAVTAGSSNVASLSYWEDADATTALTSASAIDHTNTYYIKATSDKGCTAVKAVNSIISPSPQIDFVKDIHSGCAPQCFDFHNVTLLPSNQAVISSWKWEFGDGQKSNEMNPQHCFTSAGKYDISFTALSDNGCSFSVDVSNMVTIFDNPEADFTAPSASITNPVVLFSDQSKNAAEWRWNFGENTSGSAMQNPEHSYADTGYYCVKLTIANSQGCKDSLEKCLTIFPETRFFIPNSFSPNQDGVNDYFFSQGAYLDEYEMIIFNRWGNKVFESNNMSDGWNGRMNNNGDLVQQDVYVYLVRFKDAKKQLQQYTGSVTVIQ